MPLFRGLSSWVLVGPAGLLGACIVTGADNLTDTGGPTGANGDDATTEPGGATVTSTPSTGGDTTETGSTSPVTVTTTEPATTTPGETTMPGETTTGTCADGCDTTVGASTSGGGSSTCGTDVCADSTAGDTGLEETTVDECLDCRHVFVTTMTFAGNFAAGSTPFVAADKKCNDDAMEGQLDGVFKAWISDGMTGPIDRFDTNFDGRYVLRGTTDPVANGFDDLVDGGILKLINADSAGTTVGVGPSVWTGTDMAGNPATPCGAWDSANGDGTIGMFDQKGSGWTDDGVLPCSVARRLYCFEDP